jgi:hypothetical protein
MATHVGRATVYLPHYYYHEPADRYNISIATGDNLSFLKRGMCKGQQKLGDGGCTWKPMPSSRLLYGSDLLAAGWDTTSARGGSIERELNISYTNINVFRNALGGLDRLMTPRCCGC